jgi:ABC-2 type transport system ATP-binding protein
LGPNGAGKTTTIEMLEGILSPDAGELTVLGLDWRHHAARIRQRIGVQLQETRLPEKLKVREILRLFASFYHAPRDVDEVLELVALTEKANARSAQLSGGQRQRLALGCALVGDPELLFLDEPTTGLDPQARRRVWEIVEDLKRAGRTVLLTTHYMDEAERLSDELLILDHGRIIAQGTPGSIIGSLHVDSIVRFVLGGDSIDPEEFIALSGVASARRLEDGAISLSVRELHTAVPALLEWVRMQHRELTDLHTHRPTLEDVFVALTGRNLRDE